MLVLIGVILIFLAGLVILDRVNPDLSNLERTFLSFPVGLGIFTFLMFVVNVYGIALSALNLVLMLLVIVSVGVIFSRRLKSIRLKFVRPTYRNISAFYRQRKDKWPELVLVLVILGLVLRSLILNFIWQPVTWDAISQYDFRGQRIAEKHSLAKEVFTGYSREETSYNYSPFMTSLAHAVVYIWGGDNPKFIYSLFYISLIGTFFAILKRKSSTRVALIAATLLALVPDYTYSSVIEYPNLPFTVFFGLGILYLFDWLASSSRPYLLLSAVLVGLSVWVRSEEPFWVIPPVMIVIFSIAKRKLFIKELIIYLMLALVVRLSWYFYVKSVFESINWPQIGQLVVTKFSIDFSKVIPSLTYMVNNVFLSRKAEVSLFLAALAYLKVRGRLKAFTYPLIFLVMFIGLMLAGTYFYSINFTWWNQIGGSVERTTLSLPLLFIYFGAQVFFQKSSENR